MDLERSGGASCQRQHTFRKLYMLVLLFFLPFSFAHHQPLLHKPNTHTHTPSSAVHSLFSSVLCVVDLFSSFVVVFLFYILLTYSPSDVEKGQLDPSLFVPDDYSTTETGSTAMSSAGSIATIAAEGNSTSYRASIYIHTSSSNRSFKKRRRRRKPAWDDVDDRRTAFIFPLLVSAMTCASVPARAPAPDRCNTT